MILHHLLCWFQFMFCCCSCISEINKKESDIIAVEITVEQLRERDQLLSAQNEMLKVGCLLETVCICNLESIDLADN
jgi:hypothetical protein